MVKKNFLMTAPLLMAAFVLFGTGKAERRKIYYGR